MRTRNGTQNRIRKCLKSPADEKKREREKPQVCNGCAVNIVLFLPNLFVFSCKSFNYVYIRMGRHSLRISTRVNRSKWPIIIDNLIRRRQQLSCRSQVLAGYFWLANPHSLSTAIGSLCLASVSPVAKA